MRVAAAFLSRAGLSKGAAPGPLWRRADALVRRLAALAWLVTAVMVWAQIVGLLPVDGGPFAQAPFPVQLETALFGVVYPVAAVGMWLLSAWGMVLWLSSIAARLVLTAFFSDLFGIDVAALVANLAAAGVVVTVALAARRFPPLDRA